MGETVAVGAFLVALLFGGATALVWYEHPPAAQATSPLPDLSWPAQRELLQVGDARDYARLVTFTDAHGRPCTLVIHAQVALSCGAPPTAQPAVYDHLMPDDGPDLRLRPAP